MSFDSWPQDRYCASDISRVVAAAADIAQAGNGVYTACTLDSRVRERRLALPASPIDKLRAWPPGKNGESSILNGVLGQSPCSRDRKVGTSLPSFFGHSPDLLGRRPSRKREKRSTRSTTRACRRPRRTCCKRNAAWTLHRIGIYGLIRSYQLKRLQVIA